MRNRRHLHPMAAFRATSPMTADPVEGACSPSSRRRTIWPGGRRTRTLPPLRLHLAAAARLGQRRSTPGGVAGGLAADARVFRGSVHKVCGPPTMNRPTAGLACVHRNVANGGRTNGRVIQYGSRDDQGEATIMRGRPLWLRPRPGHRPHVRRDRGITTPRKPSSPAYLRRVNRRRVAHCRFDMRHDR